MKYEIRCEWTDPYEIIAKFILHSIYSKYEYFPISGYQGMDFWETSTQKTHILKMYLILTSSSIPTWTPGSDIME